MLHNSNHPSIWHTLHAREEKELNRSRTALTTPPVGAYHKSVSEFSHDPLLFRVECVVDEWLMSLIPLILVATALSN